MRTSADCTDAIGAFIAKVELLSKRRVLEILNERSKRLGFDSRYRLS
jgi:hypothetical protein